MGLEPVSKTAAQADECNLRILSGPSQYSAILQEILLKAGILRTDRFLSTQEAALQVSPARLVGIYSDLYSSSYGFVAAEAFATVCKRLRAFLPSNVITALVELEANDWHPEQAHLDPSLLISQYSRDSKIGKLADEIRHQFILKATGEDIAVNNCKSPLKSKKTGLVKAAAKEKPGVSVNLEIVLTNISIALVQKPAVAGMQPLNQEVLIAGIQHALNIQGDAQIEPVAKSVLNQVMAREIGEVLPEIADSNSIIEREVMDGDESEEAASTLSLRVATKNFERQKLVAEIGQTLSSLTFLPGGGAISHDANLSFVVARGLIESVTYLVNSVSENAAQIYVNFAKLKELGLYQTKKQFTRSLADFLNKKLGFAQ